MLNLSHEIKKNGIVEIHSAILFIGRYYSFRLNTTAERAGI